MRMQKISNCLWFNNQAEEAAQFYVSVFGGNSKVGTVLHYDEASAEVSGQPAGSVLTVAFTLHGQDFMALNGGPLFKFTEAISLVVNCDTQEEVDHYWNALSAVPASEQCGWLKDKFGVSWQIVPTVMEKLLSGDSAKSQRAMKAMLDMKKLDIAKLQEAYDGK